MVLIEPFECDLIVSLGTNCELTYNLRHFYGVERTGLFDWTITPLACLPALIRRRFALVDDDFADSLVRVDLPNNDSVMHAPTGILLHHAFTRDENNRISPGWGDEISDVAAKFRFLGERMNTWLREANSPALFINRAGSHEAMSPSVYEKTHRPDMYAQIVDAFRDAYPAFDPMFCLINGHGPSVERVAHRPDVRTATVGDQGDWHDGQEGHWAGRRTAWCEALASLNVVLPAIRPSRALARAIAR